MDEVRFKYIARLFGEEAAAEVMRTRPTRCPPDVVLTRTKRTRCTTKIVRSLKAVPMTPHSGNLSNNCGIGGTC